jgi:predicted glutamine amidotransferase
MCLIVHKENTESKFTEEQFRSMINSNPHGLGIMYRENGRVVTHKVLGTPMEKLELWNKCKDKEEYAMHARWKTHGLVDLPNCHPYRVLSIDDGDPLDVYMMHNGVISGYPEVDKTMSDTWNFVEGVIRPIVKHNIELLWDNEAVQLLVQDFIGGGSKLLFMRSDDHANNVLLFNAKAGTEYNGCWLSNHSVARLVSNSYGHNSHTNNYYSGSRYDEYNNCWWEADKEAREKAEKTRKEADKATKEDTKEWDEPANHAGEDYYANAYSGTAQATKSAFSASEKDNLPSHYETCLGILRAMSDIDMIVTMQSEPDLFAGMILHFYTGDNMTAESIMNDIEDDTKVKDIAILVRKLSAKDRLAA